MSDCIALQIYNMCTLVKEMNRLCRAGSYYYTQAKGVSGTEIVPQEDSKLLLKTARIC